jgi:AraC-like DNA-binding protein
MDKPNVVSYEVKDNPGALPAVTCTACYDCYPWEGRLQQWSSPLWVLDYTWLRSVPIRVGSTRRPWRVRDGRVAHLYPPDTLFWEDFTGSPVTIAGGFFFFRGGELAGLDRLIRPGQYYAKFIDSTGMLGEVMSRLFSRATPLGRSCFAGLQSAMWDVFQALLTARHVHDEDYVIDASSVGDAEETFSHQVETYMRKHLREKLSLGSIADALNVSTATLRAKFRKEQNVSPMARLNELRVEIAKTRLLKGGKVCDIATRVGFYDEFHFSKVFKKITGQSPRDFMKSL